MGAWEVGGGRGVQARERRAEGRSTQRTDLTQKQPNSGCAESGGLGSVFFAALDFLADSAATLPA